MQRSIERKGRGEAFSQMQLLHRSCCTKVNGSSFCIVRMNPGSEWEISRGMKGILSLSIGKEWGQHEKGEKSDQRNSRQEGCTEGSCSLWLHRITKAEWPLPQKFICHSSQGWEVPGRHAITVGVRCGLSSGFADSCFLAASSHREERQEAFPSLF